MLRIEFLFEVLVLIDHMQFDSSDRSAYLSFHNVGRKGTVG